jgi:hypothetical protein
MNMNVVRAVDVKLAGYRSNHGVIISNLKLGTVGGMMQ